MNEKEVKSWVFFCFKFVFMYTVLIWAAMHRDQVAWGGKLI